MHRFDPATHRCKCGRWERGFAPKKELKKARAECQICERHQACDKDETLGHHGYKRPGWGFIQGDCMGEGHKPYPATDALEKYLTAVESYIERCQKALEILPSLQELHYEFEHGWRQERKTIKLTIPRGKQDEYVQDYRRTIPSFEELERREKNRLENEIEQATRERTRVTKRIENAKLI
jgi:hypothetical protein